MKLFVNFRINNNLFIYYINYNCSLEVSTAAKLLTYLTNRNITRL